MISAGEIRAGEIIGHRVWAVTAEMNALRSICSIKEWKNGFMGTPRGLDTQAQIDEISMGLRWTMFSREIELLKSNHGVHSFKERASAISYAKELASYLFCPVAIGTVEQWGIVWEHDKGYRAQCAKIHSLESVIGRLLVDRSEGELILERLRARYSLKKPPTLERSKKWLR